MKKRLVLVLMLCAAIAVAGEELTVNIDVETIAALPERTNCFYTVTLTPEHHLRLTLSLWLELPEPLAGMWELFRDFARDFEEAVVTSSA